MPNVRKEDFHKTNQIHLHQLITAAIDWRSFHFRSWKSSGKILSVTVDPQIERPTQWALGLLFVFQMSPSNCHYSNFNQRRRMYLLLARANDPALFIVDAESSCLKSGCFQTVAEVGPLKADFAGSYWEKTSSGRSEVVYRLGEFLSSRLSEYGDRYP